MNFSLSQELWSAEVPGRINSSNSGFNWLIKHLKTVWTLWRLVVLFALHICQCTIQILVIILSNAKFKVILTEWVPNFKSLFTFSLTPVSLLDWVKALTFRASYYSSSIDLSPPTSSLHRNSPSGPIAAPGNEAGLEPPEPEIEDTVRIITRVTSIKVIIMTPGITLYCSNIFTGFWVLMPLRRFFWEFESKQLFLVNFTISNHTSKSLTAFR